MASHIRYLLRKFGKATVPGIGTLEIIEIPAFVNLEENYIIPPATTLYFDADKKNDDENRLIESYQTKEKWTFESAEKEVDRLIVQLINHIDKHNVQIFGRLGQFFKRGNSIDFAVNLRGEAYNSYAIFNDENSGALKNNARESNLPSIKYHFAGAMGG